MKPTVSVVPCGSYSPEDCEKAMHEAVARCGGLDWVTPGMKIAIKVNLVAAMKPEEAATPHPELICQFVRMLLERGAEVTLGDSPGGLFNASHLNHVYDVTGLRAVEALGAKLNQDFSQKQAAFPEAAQAKFFQYTAWLDNADAVVDFCKLKTHGQMGMTNAVKNFFGTIPGTMKPEYHFKYPKAEDFADMLVDLYEYWKPRLCICDAVVAMEGNGPTMGTPRPVGALMVSSSGHALDLCGAKILGFAPGEVPTLNRAIARKLTPESLDGVEVVGDLERFVQENVSKTPAQQNMQFSAHIGGPIGRLADRTLNRVLTPFPSVKPEMCIGCSKCANICPAKAIEMKSKLPVIDRKKCIHCFCCQEFCPKGAMQVGRTWIARILNK